MKRLALLALLAVLSVAVFGQGDVPAYHKSAPSKTEKLPPILPKEQLWGPNFQQPYQSHAYELAAKIDKVLYQIPCYCYCDRSIGHGSLRSCYESTHAAHCDVCMKEMYYAYQQTKAGKSPAQIRAAIEKGDWQQINLEKAASLR